MELLVQPRSMKLLNVGLEVLHEQSYEWLNEIDFWKDEISFFYSLMVKKTLRSVPINAKGKIEYIENELISMSSGALKELQLKVEEHEHFLNHLLQSNHEDEATYREKHHLLEQEFIKFKKRFKTLNKDILGLLKQIKKS